MGNRAGFVVDPTVIPSYIPRSKAYPPPTAGIFDEPNICIPLNVKWVTFIAGLMEVLQQPDLWQGSPETIEWAQQQVTLFTNALFTGEPSCADDPVTPDCDDGCTNYLPNSGFLTYAPNNPFAPPLDPPPPGYLINPWYSNPLIFPPGAQATDAIVNQASVAFTDWPNIIGLSGFPRARFFFTGSGEVEIELLNVVQGGFCLITVDDNPATSQFVNTSLADIPDLNTIWEIIGTVFEAVYSYTQTVEIEVVGDGEHHIDITFLPRLDIEDLLGFGGGIRRVSLCGTNITGTCEDMACCDDLVVAVNAQTQAIIDALNALNNSPCGCDDTPPIIVDPEQPVDDARCQIAANVAYDVIQDSTDAINWTIARLSADEPADFNVFLQQLPYEPANISTLFDWYLTMMLDTDSVGYLTEVITKLGDAGYHSEVQCKLYCIMPSPAAMNDQIRYQWSLAILTPDLLDPTNSYLASFINGAPLSYLQSKAAQASVKPSDFDCAGCACVTADICDTEFYDLTVTDGGFLPVLSGTGVLRGQYVLGQGWLSVQDPTVQRLNLTKRHNLADVLNVRLYYHETIASATNRTVTVRNTSTGDSLTRTAMVITPLGDDNYMIQATFDPVSGDISSDWLEITLVSAAAEPTNRFTLYRMEVDCE